MLDKVGDNILKIASFGKQGRLLQQVGREILFAIRSEKFSIQIIGDFSAILDIRNHIDKD